MMFCYIIVCDQNGMRCEKWQSYALTLAVRLSNMDC